MFERHKIVRVLLTFFLIGTCVFYFSNIWKKQALFASPDTFIRSIGGPVVNKADQTSIYDASLYETSDGGYIITGYTNSYGTTDYSAFTVKLDSSGNFSWGKAIEQSTTDNAGHSVKQTSDGGYITAGYAYYSLGYQDAYVYKLDSSGNFSWAKRFGGSSYDRLYSIDLTSDGGYITAGETQSYGTGWSSGYILRLNSLGNLSWARAIGGPNYDATHSVKQTSDGGYILAGEYGSTSSPDGYEFLVIKLNTTATVSWARAIGGSLSDNAYSISQTSDGGYIVIGETQSYGTGTDMLVVKLNSSGNLSWAKRIGGAGYEIGHAVIEASDGGYIITGNTSSYGFSSGTNLILLKLDTLGNLSWARAVGATDGSFNSGYSIQQASNGEYIIAGKTTAWDSWGDIFLVRTDSNGNVSGCSNAVSITPSISSVTPSIYDPGVSLTSINPSVSSQTPTIYSADLISSDRCFGVLSVSTNPATNIQPTQATLNGDLINMGGDPSCDVWFEWGQTISYGNTTNSQSKSSTGTFSDIISGLSTGTTYHFRAVAQNSSDTVYGIDRSFAITTSPSVITNPATNIQPTQATLNGDLINMGGDPSCDVWFEWGQTISYGNTTNSQSKSSTGTFSDIISGLSTGTTYHFRAVAQNSSGTSYGSDEFFLASTIVSSNSPFATAYSFQRKTWYDGTRYWISFHSDENNRIEFWHSLEGLVWTENSAGRILADTNDFSIEADLSNLFIAYKDGNEIKARKANSYPGESFSWGLETTVYAATGGEAGDPWWNPSWNLRKQLSVSAASGNSVSAGYTVKYLVTGSTAADIYNNSLSNGNDFRIVYWNGLSSTEIDRDLVTFSDSEIEVWFALQTGILGGSTDEGYYIYYNNAGAGLPPDNKNNVYNLWASFDDLTGWTTYRGTPTVSGGILTLDPNEAIRSNDSFGPGHKLEIYSKCDQTNKRHDIGFRDGDYDFGQSVGNGIGIQLYDNSNYYTDTIAGGVVTQNQIETYSTAYINWDFEWLSGNADFYRESILKASHTTNIPSANCYVYLGSRPTNGGTLRVDWLRVRDFVAIEPIVNLKSGGSTSSPSYDYPVITRDSNGNVCIGARQTYVKRTGPLSTQYGTTTIPSGSTSINVILTSNIGDLSRAFLVMWSTGDSGAANAARHQATGYLWDDGGTTKIRFERASSTDDCQIGYFVVEAENKQFSVQRNGGTMLVGTTSVDIDITNSVDQSRALIIINSASNGENVDVYRGIATAEFKDNDTITIKRGEGTTDSMNLSFEVVEWDADSGVRVFTGEKDCSGNIANGTTEDISSLGIDRNRTWLYSSFRHLVNGLEQTAIRAELTDNNTITFDRYDQTTSYQSYARWWLVEFPAGVLVQHISDEGASADATEDTPCTGVTLNNSFVWATNNCNGTGTAFPRHNWYYQFTSSTNVQATRYYTGQASQMGIQVIDTSGWSP